MKALIMIGAALLAGCSHSAWQASAGGPPASLASPGGHVQVSTGSGFAALFGLAILAGGAYEASRGGLLDGDTRQPPEMAPDRKVSEQDCTKPLDLTLGNIRCK